MEWLFTRPTVIALAVLGAVVSVLASVLLGRGLATERQSKQLNWVGYAFMAASMVLFVIVGFRSPG